MPRSVSITVHPAALGAEYLTVADAMRQVLDLVEALERTEAPTSSERQIVWRLKEAHTNSPPFTVLAQAYPVNPAVYIDLEAARVVEQFSVGVRSLLSGERTAWLDRDTAVPLKRALLRNLNGVGRTELKVDQDIPVNVVPSNAKAATAALERAELEWNEAVVDRRRTEYGSVEVEVFGVTRWHDRPALLVIERLSRARITCTLTAQLADQLGPNHKWNEAWNGERLLVTGALHYDSEGAIQRVDTEDAEEMAWTDVSLADLQPIDLLEGSSVTEHLARIRGEDVG